MALAQHILPKQRDGTVEPGHGRLVDLEALRREISKRQADWREVDRSACCATGVESLDTLLAGGFPRGHVTALEGSMGAGLTTMVARAVARATAAGDTCVWVDPGGTLHAPALAGLGVHLERLLWVKPPEEALAWTTQILGRSGGFALIVVDAPLRISAAAGHRLVDAARAGRCAMVLMGEQVHVPATLKARLEAQVETAPSPSPAPSESEGRFMWRMDGMDSTPVQVRRLRLSIDKHRLAGHARSQLVHIAPPAAPPNEGWQPPTLPPLHKRAPAYTLGGVSIQPLVEKLHTRPRSRWRPVAPEELEQAELPSLPSGNEGTRQGKRDEGGSPRAATPGVAGPAAGTAPSAA